MMRWRRRRSERGQSVVEFALILPVLLLLTLGMIEMGFAITHDTTLVTASRQGARVGSQLVNGSPTHTCNDASAGGVAGALTVDPQIIGAIEGALLSPGSPTSISEIQEIDIFKATDSGAVSGGMVNKWVPGAGPVLPGSSPSTNLHFTPSSQPWNANTRCGSAPAPNIGVRIIYRYHFITPLGNFISVFSTAIITMQDQTVMALEPPTQ